MSNKPDKQVFAIPDLAIGLSIGFIMFTQSLTDWSVDLYGSNNPGFVKGYYTWKQAMPVMWVVLRFCMLLLPLAIFTLVRDGMFGVFTKKASTLRHAIDVVNLLALFAALTVGSLQAPLEAQLADPSFDIAKTTLFNNAAAELSRLHFFTFALNSFMALLPIVRYQEMLANKRKAA